MLIQRILAPLLVFATLLLFVNGVFASTVQCPARDSVNVVGEARSIKDNQLLYCEYYSEDTVTQQLRVEYYDQANTLIVVKDVDYSVSMLAPSVRQTDYRHGELRVAERLENAQQYRLTYLPPNSDEDAIADATINAEDNLVVDAGFDKAIRSQWDGLSRGEKRRFSFAAPPNLRTFTLVVQKVNQTDCLGQSYNANEQVCLLVKSSSTFLNWFIKPIVLIYDRNSQRLMRFVGGVNITNDKGKSQRAEINYHYLQ